MNDKQFFMAFHSAVAIIAWGVMASWTKQILLGILGALISVGIIVVVTNWLERKREDEMNDSLV